MISLDYLEPLQKKCHLPQLEALKIERLKWTQRPTAAKYRHLLANLPTPTHVTTDLAGDQIKIGNPDELSPQERQQVLASARELIPWKKGPFSLFGEEIDAEWRSDFKWQRIAPYLPSLEDKTILDIGCNNGYFMFKIAQQQPRLALGIDPVLHFHTQFHFLNHFAQIPSLQFEMFGVEHLEYFKECFDVILSMGIIYHHRHPIQQLTDIHNSLKPGGQLILETIGIPGEKPYALFPPGRYARMKNIWFIPTLSCLINWAHKARFKKIEVISETKLEVDEQRATAWSPPPYQSLIDSLDPNDPNLTIEGHPAPYRFSLAIEK